MRKKEFVRSDFLILASFVNINIPTYFVYVPDKDILYRTGYYYFTVVYQTISKVSISSSTNAATTEGINISAQPTKTNKSPYPQEFHLENRNDGFELLTLEETREDKEKVEFL